MCSSGKREREREREREFLWKGTETVGKKGAFDAKCDRPGQNRKTFLFSITF